MSKRAELRDLLSDQTNPLPAFYFNELTFLQGIARAASQAATPVIVMVTPNVIDFLGLGAITAIYNHVAERSRVSMYLQLDHAHRLDLVEACVAAGFDAVMIDAGNLAPTANIELTRQVVEFAHAKDVWVEGQCGVLAGTKYPRGQVAETSVLPSPDEVKRFVGDTGVDGVAVAFGNVHVFDPSGYELTGAELDFEVLAACADAAGGLPVVMHGADQTPAEELGSAVRNGVRKANFGPVLKAAYLDELARRLARPYGEADMREILGDARDAVTSVALDKIAALTQGRVR